jgi:hypothetical protein
MLIFLSFFIFVLIQLILNIVLFAVNNIYNSKIFNKNSICTNNCLLYAYYDRKEWKNNSSFLVRIYLSIVYFFYLHLDFIINLHYLDHTKLPDSYNKLNNKIDFMVVLYFFITIIFYILGSIKNSVINTYFEIIIINIFIWRLTHIFFIKLNEISIFKKSNLTFESFNRTFILFILNFIEIIIIYSFLYSTQFYNIINERNFQTIVNTLLVFNNWYIEGKTFCVMQNLLILSQVFIFIIIISLFIGNITNVNYKSEI